MTQIQAINQGMQGILSFWNVVIVHSVFVYGEAEIRGWLHVYFYKRKIFYKRIYLELSIKSGQIRQIYVSNPQIQIEYLILQFIISIIYYFILLSDKMLQQAGQAQAQSLGIAETATSYGQFIRTLTISEYNMILQQKQRGYEQQLAKLKLQKLGLQSDVNNLKRTCEAYEAMTLLLQRQAQQNEKTIQHLKQQANHFQQWIQQLRTQRDSVEKKLDQQIRKQRQQIRIFSSNLQKQKERYESMLQVQQNESNKKILKVEKQLRQLIDQNKQCHKDLETSKKEHNILLQEFNDLKRYIAQQLSKFNLESSQPVTQYELVDIVARKLSKMEEDSLKLTNKLRSYEKNAPFENYDFSQRVDAICLQYQSKATQSIRKLDELEGFINNLLSKNVKRYQNCYGEQLKAAFKNQMIDFSSSVEALKVEIDKNKQKKCQQCNLKERKYQDYQESVKIKIKDFEKKQIQLRQECLIKIQDLQNKHAINLKQIQNQKTQIETRLRKTETTLQTIQAQNQRSSASIQQEHQKVNQQLKLKIQKLSSDLQTANLSNTKLKTEMENLSKLNNEYQSQITQKQLRLQNLNQDQLTISNKNLCLMSDVDALKKNQMELRQQISQYESKITDYKTSAEKKETILNQKILNLERIVQQKRNQIDQFDNNLCRIVNINFLKKNQPEVKRYKQALECLSNCLQNNTPDQKDYSFKVPSISNKFDEKMNWMKGILSRYAQIGQNITSRYLGTITNQQVVDFNKLLQNSNIIFICSTTKKTTFQLFITKLCKNMTDSFKIVLLSAEKQLQFPPKYESKKSVRVSMINSAGQLVLGKQELIISKQLQITFTVKNDGYFGPIDLKDVFRVDPDEKPLIQTIEVFQIVPN